MKTNKVSDEEGLVAKLLIYVPENLWQILALEFFLSREI